MIPGWQARYLSGDSEASLLISGSDKGANKITGRIFLSAK